MILSYSGFYKPALKELKALKQFLQNRIKKQFFSGLM